MKFFTNNRLLLRNNKRKTISFYIILYIVLHSNTIRQKNIKFIICYRIINVLHSNTMKTLDWKFAKGKSDGILSKNETKDSDKKKKSKGG